MSNLLASTDITIILIKYSDGVQTLVTTGYYDVNYILKTLDKAIEHIDNPENVTWTIDWHLQREFDLFQTLISKEDSIKNAYIINCPYPYSLGENEEEDQIKEFYPDYIYPYEYNDDDDF